MSLSNLCTQNSYTWHSKYADVFLVRDENQITKTIFRYALPFAEDQDAVLQEKYSLTAEDRIRYYQNLVQGIQRNRLITGHLINNHVPSILRCELIEQEQDLKTGQNVIFIQTEEVKPIEQVLFNKEINILTLLDIFIRLQIIVRDIAKSPCCVSHRCISLDEVYMNADGKILLSGFCNSISPGASEIIPYLPDQAKHIPAELIRGAKGDAGTDMQTLTRMLYNILSGLPWNTQWKNQMRIAPAFAPPGLTDILVFGLTCTEADCNYYRRRLLNFRKDLSKTKFASMMIPISNPYRKQFIYE